MKNIDLQARLAKLPPDMNVVIWLPGSRIDLSGTPSVHQGAQEILVEGNVRPGSALDQ